MTFVRSDLCFTVTKELGDQNGIDTSNFSTEHIILKVKVAKSWLTVMAIYRPPSIPTSQWKFELNRLFEVVTTFPNDVICVGDFNSNLLDPKDSGHLNNLLGLYGLKNLIKLPTRIGKTSSTLLDLILTKKHNKNIFIGRSGCSYQRSFSNIYYFENHSSAIAISQNTTEKSKEF